MIRSPTAKSHPWDLGRTYGKMPVKVLRIHESIILQSLHDIYYESK